MKTGETRETVPMGDEQEVTNSEPEMDYVIDTYDPTGGKLAHQQTMLEND